MKGEIRRVMSLSYTHFAHLWPTVSTYVEHSFGLFGQGNVVYLDCKIKGICQVDGFVHRVYRTVPDVEQCGCMVKSQVAALKQDTSQNLEKCNFFLHIKQIFISRSKQLTPLELLPDKGFQVWSSSSLLLSLLFYQKTDMAFLLLKLH